VQLKAIHAFRYSTGISTVLSQILILLHYTKHYRTIFMQLLDGCPHCQIKLSNTSA